jgi:hypothetical protein
MTPAHVRIVKQEPKLDDLTQTTDYSHGWTTDERYVFQAGRLVLQQLTVRPSEKGTPPGGITSDVLRTLPTGKLLLGRLAEALQKHGHMRVPSSVAKLLRRGAKLPQWSRKDDLYYAALAAQYLNILRSPEGRRKPIEILAQRRGEKKTARMRSHVNLARRNGFLTTERQGTPGGALTAKAREVLAPYLSPSDLPTPVSTRTQTSTAPSAGRKR